MKRNRFERVDEVQDDAITLELACDGQADMARVHVPAGDSSAAPTPRNTSEPLPRVDAFRGAVKLANTLRLPIVVMGDEAGWDAVWGDLYRAV